ncbi:hypothetical protein FLGSB24_24060 [Flavobacterium sp. GSB-24]|nr:hypothetical protein FLGSB24_24060 [Flavobacterium sp. GSB-24]
MLIRKFYKTQSSQSFVLNSNYRQCCRLSDNKVLNFDKDLHHNADTKLCELNVLQKPIDTKA